MKLVSVFEGCGPVLGQRLGGLALYGVDVTLPDGGLRIPIDTSKGCPEERRTQIQGNVSKEVAVEIRRQLHRGLRAGTIDGYSWRQDN